MQSTVLQLLTIMIPGLGPLLTLLVMARKNHREADSIAVETANHVMDSLHKELEYWRKEATFLRERIHRLEELLSKHGIINSSE